MAVLVSCCSVDLSPPASKMMSSLHCVVDAVPGSKVDLQFSDATGEVAMLPRVSMSQAVDADLDARPALPIFRESIQSR